ALQQLSGHRKPGFGGRGLRQVHHGQYRQREGLRTDRQQPGGLRFAAHRHTHCDRKPHPNGAPNRDSHRQPHPNSDSFSNPRGHGYIHIFAILDCDSHTFRYTNQHPHFQPDFHPNEHPDRHGFPHPQRYTNFFAHRHSIPVEYAFLHRHPYIHPHRHGNQFGDQHPDTDSHPYRHFHPDIDTDSNANRHTDFYPYHHRLDDTNPALHFHSNYFPNALRHTNS